MLFAFTNYEAKSLLDHVLGKADYDRPTELYLIALTADPTKSGSRSSEVSGGGYTPQAILAAMSAANLSTGISTNTTTVQTATATTDLGIVTYAALVDQNGVMRYYAQLDEAFIFNEGEAFQFIPGQLQIRFR